MARLLDRHGECELAVRSDELFATLVNSIIGQQLSAKAAATIRSRVEVIVPGFGSRGFLASSIEVLRGAGLSAAKARSILELARRITDGRLNLDSLARKSDAEAVEELIEVPGIGRWTAEMFLIFGLKRPNVLALSDAGLRRATRLLYGEEATLEGVGKLWQPYCSVASWYLWRHLDAC